MYLVKTGLLLAIFMLSSTFGWSQSQKVIIIGFLGGFVRANEPHDPTQVPAQVTIVDLPIPVFSLISYQV